MSTMSFHLSTVEYVCLDGSTTKAEEKHSSRHRCSLEHFTASSQINTNVLLINRCQSQVDTVLQQTPMRARPV